MDGFVLAMSFVALFLYIAGICYCIAHKKWIALLFSIFISPVAYWYGCHASKHLYTRWTA